MEQNIQSLIAQLLKGQQSGPQAFASSLPYLNYASNLNSYNKPAGNIASAMTDLNNPLYQQMYGQFQQQGQHNLAQTIAQLSGQNRKLAMMGRTPLFDAERGGEQMFRGLTQGYQDVQDKASGQALNQLGESYKTNALQGQMNQQAGLGQANAGSSVLGALTKLFGL